MDGNSRITAIAHRSSLSSNFLYTFENCPAFAYSVGNEAVITRGKIVRRLCRQIQSDRFIQSTQFEPSECIAYRINFISDTGESRGQTGASLFVVFINHVVNTLLFEQAPGTLKDTGFVPFNIDF